uniref:non-specific serine/threonine protein kinase n=1 Tax=Chromera velia CCMP2878 TaxID=1169474 RepID=A0A0G4FQW6_9ALVE|mmetsp:Transcript_46155/g.90975  ORF Transcript_46155/g.90975 Transcript_46155/m.90975 type:complete len:370 (+) Transcript_46155:139-1248(+)|eukprot:Cvel_3612.t1-p1 / transcript=Cvel_3612.t1 / gene=Cvel_3612 / organism=Chromera_velia_CCMP2878 / gene_product=Serine/threonine-protein kinase Nek1, putative / transcript_product=Serine/threonine-protein kinase Nek1, putative / location=Cvel_scaffold148:54740-56474(+) / protein_length=369 / sequence_SO=supercontig / SO=protein_coding / is_pseudo=false
MASQGANYQKIKEVGAGSFGKAILVKDKSGKQYIMKVIDISRMNQKEKKEAMQEAKLLATLKHPYIVAFRESWVEGGQLCIVMDYAEAGDLYGRIQKQKRTGQSFSEQQVLRWFTQALLAIKHMHDRHILHRDIKSSNFFLTASGRLRVGDFGIAKVLDHTGAFARTTIGTPYYLPPEICKEQPYSWAADIWSIGIFLFELCALRVPFDAPNIRALVDKIIKSPVPAIPSTYSPALRQLVADMLQKDWKKRPSAADILQRDIVQAEIKNMLAEEQARKAAGDPGSNPASRAQSPARGASPARQPASRQGTPNRARDPSPARGAGAQIAKPPSRAQSPARGAPMPGAGVKAPSRQNSPALGRPPAVGRMH